MRRRVWMLAAAAGVAAGPALGQDETNTRARPADRPATRQADAGQRGAGGGEHAAMPGLDRQAAIGHALTMSIDGSNLWFLAQQGRGGGMGGAGIGRGAAGAGIDRRAGAAGADRGAAGAAATDRGAGAAGTDRAAGADRIAGGAGADAGRGAGPAAGGAGNPGDAAGALQQHARDAFQGSRRLFQAVREDNRGGAGDAVGGGVGEFQRAAVEYSRFLESLCNQQGAGIRPDDGRGAAAGRGTGAGPDEAPAGAIGADRTEATGRAITRAETSARPTGDRALRAEDNAQGGGGAAMIATGADATRIALINHAVKEAVEGVALRQMIQQHGANDQTSQALLSHADQMVASARQTIDSLDRMGGAGAGGGAARGDEPRNPIAPLGADAARAGDDINRPTNPTTPARRVAPDAGTRGGAAAVADRAGAVGAGGGGAAERLAQLGRQVIDSVQTLDPAGGADRAGGDRGGRGIDTRGDRGAGAAGGQGAGTRGDAGTRDDAGSRGVGTTPNIDTPGRQNDSRGTGTTGGQGTRSR